MANSESILAAAQIPRFAAEDSHLLGMTTGRLQFAAEHGNYVIGSDYADQLVVFVDDWEGHEIVFVEEFGDFVVASFLMSEDEGLLRKRKQWGIGLRQDEFHQGDSADESAVGIDEINGTDGFDSAFELAHHADGVFDGSGDGEGEELRGHTAGGGFFAMFEEFDYLLAGSRLHLDKDLFSMILRKVAKKVGGGVGIHFFDDVGGAFGVEGFDNRFLEPGLELFEGFGGNVFVQGAEDGFALIRGEIFDDVGDVGWMECGQTLVRDFEFDAARGVGFDKVNETPGDGAGRNSLEQGVERSAGREASQKTPDGAADANVDRLDAQDRMRVSGFDHGVDLKIDIVDADDFASVNVNDLLIEEIAFEQEQAFGAVGGRPVRGIGGGVNVGVNGGDGGEGKYAVAGFGFNDERCDAVAVFLRSKSDFAHTSRGRSRRVVDGGAEKLGKRQRGHPG